MSPLPPESLPDLPQEVAAALLDALYAGDTPTDADRARLVLRFPENEASIRAHWAHAVRLREEEAASPGAAPAADAVLPQLFGDYRVLRQIGQGGMGTVYEAEQISLGRRVAIKVMRDPMSVRVRERFEREVSTLASIHHRNVVRVHGRGMVNGFAYIVMELLDGASLVRWRPRDRLPSGTAMIRVLRIGITLARTLADLHERGVIHRDVKPENVLLAADGEPVLIDFGLVKANDAVTLTRPREFLGTLAYTAPEQADGRDVDHRADVFGLGATLYELLTGRTPFRARTLSEYAREVANAVVSPARTLNPAISKDLATVLAKAVAPNRSERYASCVELADDLQAAMESRPVQARPLGAATHLWRWTQRRPSTAALVMLVPLLLIAAMILVRQGVQASELRSRQTWMNMLGEAITMGRRGNMSEQAESLFAELCRLQPLDPDAWAFRAVNMLHPPGTGAASLWNGMLGPEREGLRRLLALAPAPVTSDASMRLLAAWTDNPQGPDATTVATLSLDAARDNDAAVRFAAMLALVPGETARARARSIFATTALRAERDFKSQFLLGAISVAQVGIPGWRAALAARVLRPELEIAQEVEIMLRFRLAQELTPSAAALFPNGREQAIADLRALVASNPAKGLYVFDLAYCLQQARLTEDWWHESERLYRRAIELGMDIVGRFNLGNLLMETHKDRPDRDACYREIIELRQHVQNYYGYRYGLWQSYAYCLNKLGRHKEAAEVLRRGIQCAASNRNLLRAELIDCLMREEMQGGHSELPALLEDAIAELGATESATPDLVHDLSWFAHAAMHLRDNQLSTRLVARCREALAGTLPEQQWPEELLRLAAEVAR